MDPLGINHAPASFVPERAARVTEKNLKAILLMPVKEKSPALCLMDAAFFTFALSRAARGLPPALKMAKEFCQRHRIKDAVRGHAAFTGHLNAPVHVVELPDRVGIRIDAKYAAVIESFLMPAPVKIKPPRMRVDFDRNSILGAGFQDLINIDLVAGTALQLAPGHVTDNGRMRILKGLEDTIGLILLKHLET
jgi:hypothetical protein